MASSPQPRHERHSRSAPGFRFSKLDAAAIVAVTVATIVAWPWLHALSLLAPITLFHFFLFCNVFRVRRELELFWAATFIVNVVIWFAVDQFNWWSVMACQLPVTLAVVMVAICSQRYHGIFYDKIRPERRSP